MEAECVDLHDLQSPSNQHLREGGLLTLAGAKAALGPTAGMYAYTYCLIIKVSLIQNHIGLVGNQWFKSRTPPPAGSFSFLFRVSFQKNQKKKKLKV